MSYKNKKIVALIPIKLNSKRIPYKNIKKFDDGKELMSFIQETCSKSKLIDDVYIYCSDTSVRSHILENIKFLERPKFLDSDEVNSNHIIKSFIDLIDADIYIEAHATGPFTKLKSIEDSIINVIDNDFDSAFMAKEMKEFFWIDNKPFNFDLKNFPRTQDLKPIYSEAPGAYIFKKETFERYNRRIGVNPYIHIVDPIEAIDIDNPVDFEIANAIYMSKKYSERNL